MKEEKTTTQPHPPSGAEGGEEESLGLEVWEKCPDVLVFFFIFFRLEVVSDFLLWFLPFTIALEEAEIVMSSLSIGITEFEHLSSVEEGWGEEGGQRSSSSFPPADPVPDSALLRLSFLTSFSTWVTVVDVVDLTVIFSLWMINTFSDKYFDYVWLFFPIREGNGKIPRVIYGDEDGSLGIPSRPLHLVVRVCLLSVIERWRKHC